MVLVITTMITISNAGNVLVNRYIETSFSMF